MNITNDRDVMVFKFDDKYVVGISKKNQNGEYEKAYFPIQFNKDVELDNMTLIKIKNAWLSFYNWTYEDKKGTKFFIRCTDFDKVEKEKTSGKDDMTSQFEEFGNEHQEELQDFDLPF